MTALRYHEMQARTIRPRVERRLGYTPNLMIVIVDFYDGPKTEPDPPHDHPHEQVSYVAEGQIILLMDGQHARLGPGDVFLVASGKPHAIQQLTEHVRLIDCFTPIRQDFLEH